MEKLYEYQIEAEYKMKDLIYWLKESLGLSCGIQIVEMAVATNDVKLGKNHYRIALHGPAAGDRPYPHIHIYRTDDKYPWKKFNFEISLVDILCNDEINLVCQEDRTKGIVRKNKNKCSWIGYKDIKDDFEDWLESKCNKPGDFKNNLDFLIWSYDDESKSGELLNYIKDKGKKVLDKYKEYFETN